MHDSGVLYDMCRWDGSDDANSNDPNTNDKPYKDMDATNLANNPSNMENASIPMMGPRTNHKSLGDRYIRVQ